MAMEQTNGFTFINVEFSKEWAVLNIDIFTRIMYTTRQAKIMHYG
jgi:hypothetical protein